MNRRGIELLQIDARADQVTIRFADGTSQQLAPGGDPVQRTAESGALITTSSRWKKADRLVVETERAATEASISETYRLNGEGQLEVVSRIQRHGGSSLSWKRVYDRVDSAEASGEAASANQTQTGGEFEEAKPPPV